MALEPERRNGYMVEKFDSDGITIASICYTQSFIVQPQSVPRIWSVTEFGQVQVAQMQELIAYQAEVILIGAGMKQKFLPSSLQQLCMQRFIACDVMTNASACRTYNVLALEGRRVLLALIFSSND